MLSLEGDVAQVNKKKAFRGAKRRKTPGLARALSLSQSARNLAFSVIFSVFSPLVSAQNSPPPGESIHLGPLYDRFRLTLEDGERTEAAGPLLAWQQSGSGRLFSFSPLFSIYRDRAIPQTEAEFLYPILTLDKFGSQYRFQLFQWISWSGGESVKGGDVKRTTFFPIYFHQSSPRPSENYTAVVPFYGRMENRLFRDEIFFVMLPLYLQTKKGTMVTDNILVPFFHVRHGDGLKGWQFWPLAGGEHKVVTTSTNNWGDVNLVPGHKKFFALWPFFFNNTLGIGSTNVQRQLVILPFYTSQVASNRVSKSYGFPIGYTHTIDREAKYEERDAPWPLVEFAHGEGKNARRVWPFFSEIKTPIAESDFYLWPVYKYNRVTSAPLDRERTRWLLFLYSDLIERNTTKNTELHRRDCWPLFTWRKDHDDNTRLQVLSLLEPLLPGNKSIERLYSPAYALYREEHNAKTGDRSRSVLWNLYRSETRGETVRQSGFFGLFQREKSAEQTKWRIFFIRFTTHSRPPEP